MVSVVLMCDGMRHFRPVSFADFLHGYPCRRGYPCAVILTQTTSFSSAVMATQWATSSTVRPQPRHISSNVVEQTATQGVSGRSFTSSIELFFIRFFWLGLTQNCPSVVALPCRIEVLPAAAPLAGTILRKSYW